ncbi:MAG: AsmA family protein, partial [Pseudomonadota bacterium]
DEGSGTASAVATPGAAANPLAPVAALNLHGTLTLGELKVTGATLTQVKLTLKTGGGRVILEPMSASLYGGSYKGSARLTAGDTGANWQVKEEINGVQVGPLLRDVADSDMIEGTGNLSANLSGSGLSDAEMRRSAKGEVRFAFSDGALNGINLAQTVREVKAMLKGQTAKQEGPLKTDFSALTGSLQVGGGKATNRDLLMKSPFLRVTGEGDANLVSEELDYLLRAKVVGTAKGQGGSELRDLEGVTVPVRVTGTFADPSFSPDLEVALKEVANQRLEGEKAKLQEKVQQELTDEQDKLKGQVGEELQKALKGFKF